MSDETTYVSRRARRRAARKNPISLSAASAGRASAVALTTFGLVFTSGVAANASADGPEQGHQSAPVQPATGEHHVESTANNSAEAHTTQQTETQSSQQSPQPSDDQPGSGFTTAGTLGASQASSTESNSSVVGAAYSVIGSPYSWGGTTPSGFDCSGFINWAYEQAGQGDLPRTTFGMDASLQHVSTPEPGDIVLANNSTHGGIYVGDGQVISATSSGVSVHDMNTDWHQVNAIVRPA